MERPFRSWPPPAAPRAFIRERLHTRLAARFEQRLVVVRAGAGFGKTTLLAQALSENLLDPRGRDVYLGCEAEDSSASTLLVGLLHGLGVETTGATDASVDDVAAAVWSAAPADICLVIDDAHTLTPGSPGEEAIAALVERLPVNGHVVVASRREVAVPVSRLRTLGRCDAIGEDDLRLDDDEVALLAERHGVDAATLVGLGGWPAIVELAATAGGGVASAFVSEEVLASLPPTIQQQFALIVAVGGGDADTLAAVCGAPVDSTPLAALPLVAIDPSGTIRPHALWADLLRDRVPADVVGDARRAAAAALRRRGAHVRAFELLAASGDWTAALPTMFDACNDQLTPPWADVMDRWRQLVPAALGDEPEVVYLRAMIDRSRDSWLPSVSRDFDDACAGFNQRGDLAREIAALVRACSVAMVKDDHEWMARIRERGVELIARGLPLQPVTAANDIWRAYREGDFERVIRLTEVEAELEPRLRHIPPYYRVAALLAAGRADEVGGLARRAAELGTPVVPAFATGWATSAPAFVALALGDLDVFAGATMGDIGPRFGLSERVPHLAVAAIAAANSGAITEAEALLARIDGLLEPPARREMIDGFRAVAAAALAVARHDEAGAVSTLADALDGELRPVGLGMALRWYPCHAYLFHPPSRELLDTEPSGASRRRLLDGCRALLASRDGQPIRPDDADALDDMLVVIAGFGINLAVELVVRLAADGPRADAAIATLIERAPDATRRALRELARVPELERRSHALLAKLAIPPPQRVRIELLGAPVLRRGGEVVDDANWRRARVRQLVAALTVFHRLRRQRVGVMLWPDADESAVSANLRMTLSYVQGLLEPHRAKGDASWFVRQDSGALVLGGGEHLSVDVWDFDDELDRAAAANRGAIPSAELRHLRSAIELWRGDPLVDLVELDWAAPHLRRLEERYVGAIVRAAELLAASGDGAAAIEIAERGLAVEPWSESLHSVIIGVHLAGGDRDAARRALRRCEDDLAEMGLTPSAAALALSTRIDAR